MGTYSILLLLHSLVRYLVLIFMIIVIARSFTGWQNNKAFTTADNKFSLWLLISTHIQFLLGLILYFVSPAVKFSGTSMKDPVLRYWLVEHISMMLIAVVLITVARSTAKRLAEPAAKHKRLFIFNLIAALIVIVAIVMMKDRPFFTLPV